jgi:hypothetical protein
MVQLTNNEKQGETRVKRGLFNFVGHISHSLFRTLNSDNEGFYNEKISQLEEEQADLIKLSEKETVVVKATLKSVKKTLTEFLRMN